MSRTPETDWYQDDHREGHDACDRCGEPLDYDDPMTRIDGEDGSKIFLCELCADALSEMNDDDYTQEIFDIQSDDTPHTEQSKDYTK